MSEHRLNYQGRGVYTLPRDIWWLVATKYHVRDDLETAVYGDQEGHVYFDSREDLNQAVEELLLIHAITFEPEEC